MSSHPGYLCINSNKSLVCPPWIALRIQNCLMWSTKAGKIGQIWMEHHQLNAWIIPNQILTQMCTLKRSPIHDAHAWKIGKWPSQHTEKKKMGRGSPIHNDFSFTPSPFPSQHKVCVGGGGDRSGWGTCTTLNYWNLHQSTTPGLIDKIVKIDSQNKSVPLNVPISWIQSHQGLSN